VAEPIPLRAPRVRRAPIPSDAVFVVRGDARNAVTDRLQAEAFLRRYPDWGRYGLSGYYARDDDEIDDLASDLLDRFPALTVLRAHDLLPAGFEVVPTFRSPHVTIAFEGDLDARLGQIYQLVDRSVANPYHAREPDQPDGEGTLQ
jgi:hypothetical protein